MASWAARFSFACAVAATIPAQMVRRRAISREVGPKRVIAILNCKPEGGDYPRLLRGLLERAAGRRRAGGRSVPDYELRVYEVAAKGEFPKIPSATHGENEFDSVIVTGSRCGVYEGDEYPWITRMHETVRQLYDARVPMVGICFGHQLICNSLGGSAAKNERGWEIGRVETYPPPSVAKDLSELAVTETCPVPLRLLLIHGDAVLPPEAGGLPDGMTNIGGTDLSPCNAVYEPGRILTFQGHPEFDVDIVARIWNRVRDAVTTMDDDDFAAQVDERNGEIHDGFVGLCILNHLLDSDNPYAPKPHMHGHANDTRPRRERELR